MGRKLFWSLGSQSEKSGVMTSLSRVISWSNHHQQLNVLQPPVDSDTKSTVNFIKTASSHRRWFGISSFGKLYTNDCSTMTWSLVDVPEGKRVIDVDGGSSHYGFITEDGDVYTWGNNRFGVLGHGNDNLEDVSQPKLVEYFRNKGIKIIKIGCGGNTSWSGGFTLCLSKDNELFVMGKLGSSETSLPMIIAENITQKSFIFSINAGEDWAGIVTLCFDDDESFTKDLDNTSSRLSELSLSNSVTSNFKKRFTFVKKLPTKLHATRYSSLNNLRFLIF